MRAKQPKAMVSRLWSIVAALEQGASLKQFGLKDTVADAAEMIDSLSDEVVLLTEQLGKMKIQE